MPASNPTAPPARTTRRRGFAFGAVAAGLVTAVFAVVGDGVNASATGSLGVLLEHGHTAVWALLTAALAWAAVRGRWQRASSALALAALVLYLAFLAALLVTS